MIFTRVAPVVAIAEVKSILNHSGDQYSGKSAPGHHHLHVEEDPNFVSYLSKSSFDFAKKSTSTQAEPMKMATSSDATASSAGTAVKAAVDKFQKLEGIGPKIDELLKAGGINIILNYQRLQFLGFKKF